MGNALSNLVREELIREEHESYRIQPTTFRVLESFEDFVALNPELVVEQNSNGNIVILSPAGSESSRRNAETSYQLQRWCKRFGGKTFDSSGLFTLPDGSKRGPDASWIAADRWEALSKEDRETFAPICPDFVIELRSRSDRLAELKQKMSEYLVNGVRLGWLSIVLVKDRDNGPNLLRSLSILQSRTAIRLWGLLGRFPGKLASIGREAIFR